jgi:hypothetical protein
MDYINKIHETGGAGDWGTDKARARVQKDTPGQDITKGKKMKTFKDILQNVDEAMSLSDIRKKKEREEKRKKDGETRSQRMNRKVYGNMMGRLKDDVQEAMSEKDKAKRLAMIKKAVEKINRNNAEKAKKDALAMMKASGMFDEELATIEEALGNKNPSHTDKVKLDKDGTIHNLRGKKMASSYTIKPRVDGDKLTFGAVDNFGNISTMTLQQLLKVLK